MFSAKVKNKLLGHKGSINAIDYSKDGIYCMTGGYGPDVNLWNPAKEFLIKSYSNEHANDLRDLAIRSDNCQFVSCGDDKNANIWDISKAIVIRRIRGHYACVNSVSYNADETVLATASYDRKVCIWDMRTNVNKPLQTLSNFSDSVSSVTISEKNIHCSSVDGTVSTYDIRQGRLIQDQLYNPVTFIGISNDSNCILASTLSSKILLLDKENGDVLNEYCGHTNSKYLLKGDFSRDDSHVLSGSEDGLIFVWNLVESGRVIRLSGHDAAVTVVKFNPQRDAFLSSDAKGNLIFWECNAGSD